MNTVAKKQAKTSRAAKPRGTTEPKPLVLPPGVMPGKESMLAGEVQQIPVALIDIPKSKTDRQGMSDEELGIPELAQSIATVGMQQPILVAKKSNGRFELIFGERRLRAARLLKHERTPGIVRDATAIDPVLDQQLVEARAVENIHRLDPSPIGEALAIADIFDIKLAERLRQWREASSKDLADKGPSVSYLALLRAEAIARTADRVGKPVAWVRDRMFLSGFSGKARELVSSGRLPLTHAREIAKVADPRTRDELAAEFAIDGRQSRSDGQPGDIDDLKRRVAGSLYSLTQVPWQLGVAFGGKPACSECPHNSLNNPGLFEGSQFFGDDPRHANKVAKGYWGAGEKRPEPKSGVCTKPSCYIEKTAEANRAVSSAATKVINRYEPAKAARKPDAAKLLSGSSIAEVTPKFVKSGVVTERVNTRLEARAQAGKAKPSAGKRQQQPRHDHERQQAIWAGEGAYRHAVHAWRDKIANPAMASYLAAMPGRWAMFTVAKNVKAWQKAASYNAKPKDFESPEILRALRLIETPNLEGLVALEGMCGTKLGLFGDLDSGNYDPLFIAKILSTLGVQVEAPPVEKTFVDRELAKLAKARATDKKSGFKRHADDEDDDQEDE